MKSRPVYLRFAPQLASLHLDVVPESVIPSGPLGGWDYAAIYRFSAWRRAALSGWLDYDNRLESHGSLGHHPPLARLEVLRNNVSGSYI